MQAVGLVAAMAGLEQIGRDEVARGRNVERKL